jgi:hypothetical protein
VVPSGAIVFDCGQISARRQIRRDMRNVIAGFCESSNLTEIDLARLGLDA